VAFTTTPYCTLAQVKNALNLQGSSQDSWIQTDILPIANAFIDEYCGRTWQTDGSVGSPATRLYDGSGYDTMLIDECQTLVSVTDSFAGDITSDCVLGPNSRINLGQPGYKLARKSGFFAQGRQNYTVRGVFGNATVPYEISRAAVRISVHLKKMQDTNYANYLIEAGGVRQGYKMSLPDDVIQILEMHRRRAFFSRTY
jgi:hypothetical protein